MQYGENKLFLSFIMLCLSVVQAADANSAGRTALVIGNSNYQSNPLKNPVNDAKDMARALKFSGFEVTLETDVDLRTMETAVRSFGRSLRKGGTGLFYYAGHGVQVNGSNYLIPIGAVIESQSDVRYEAVNAGLVLGKMEDADNGLNIVILDACRNNPFRGSFRSHTPGLARMDSPTGSLVAYATAPGSVAVDGNGENGIYTKHLVQKMKKPGLTIEQVLKQVRVAVLEETDEKQTPWESSSLTGTFCFTPAQSLSGEKTKESSSKSGKSGSHQSFISQKDRRDLDKLLAEAEERERHREKMREQRMAKLAREKSRKGELKKQINKYKRLVENYGEQYREQAWQALTSDFPMLTSGLETGNTSGLRIKAGLLKAGDVRKEPVTGMEFVWVEGGCFMMGSPLSGKKR